MISKFRAWEESAEKGLQMWSWKEMCEIGLGQFFNNPKHELMQYTGLKDKNGVEIYDGDIVKLTEKTINGGIDTHTCKVFQSKSGAWRLEGHPDFSRKYMTKRELYSVKSRTEVIGNIWEDGEFTEVAE